MNLVELYRQHLQARALTTRTIKSVLENLARFSAWLENNRQTDDWRAVVQRDILDFHDHLAKRTKTNGLPLSQDFRFGQIYVLRAFFGFLHETGHVLINPCADLPEFRKQRGLPRDILSATEVLRLLSQPKLGTPFGFRDRVILEILYATAIRPGELCALSVYDIDLKEGTLTVRRSKNGKGRIVPLGQTAAEWLREWLEVVRPRLVARVTSSAHAVAERLFFTRHRHPLSSQNLLHLFRQYTLAAGLSPTITTHSLRHSCASEMLRGGASVRHVQEMLGHTSIRSTQIYTRVVPDDLQAVHARTAPSERRRSVPVPPFNKRAWRVEPPRRKRRPKPEQ